MPLQLSKPRHQTRHVRPWSSSTRSCMFCQSCPSTSVILSLPCNPPLNSPLHNLIRNNHWYSPVEDLVARASESVEDSGVGGSRKRVLSVLSKTVLDNALLRLAACFLKISCQYLFSCCRCWRTLWACGGHTGSAPCANVEVEASWVLHPAEHL